MSDISPLPLNTGETLASFQSSGTVEVVREALNNLHNIGAINPELKLSNFESVPSVLSTFLTCLKSIELKEKIVLQGGCFQGRFSGLPDIWEVIFSLIVLKYSLEALQSNSLWGGLFILLPVILFKHFHNFFELFPHSANFCS